MQGKLFQKCTNLLYCIVLSLGSNVNTRQMSKPDMGSIFHIKKINEIFWYIFNAFNLLGYYTNTDASILVYKFRPKRTGFNMNAEYTRPQLTFLALHPCLKQSYYRCIWLLKSVPWLLSGEEKKLEQDLLLPTNKNIYLFLS